MSTKTATMLRVLGTLLVAVMPLACAGTREEPPSPPPPPVDPAAFSGPARSPAPEVDLNANLDAANVWDDGGSEQQSASAVPPAVPDAGSDAQVAAKQKRGSK